MEMGFIGFFTKLESLYCHQQKSSLALPNILPLQLLSPSCAVFSFAVDHKLPHQNKTLTGYGKWSYCLWYGIGTYSCKLMLVVKLEALQQSFFNFCDVSLLHSTERDFTWCTLSKSSYSKVFTSILEACSERESNPAEILGLCVHLRLEQIQVLILFLEMRLWMLNLSQSPGVMQKVNSFTTTCD